MSAAERAESAKMWGLRPLSLGELLDQTVRIYRKNFLTCVGIAAVVEIPVHVLILLQQLLARLAAGGASTARSSLVSSSGQFLATSLASVVLEVVVIAAMARLVSGAGSGQTTGVSDAYRQVGWAWWPLARTLLGAGLFALVLLLWFLVPCLGWATGLGLLIFYLGVVVPLAGLIVVNEQRSGYQALRRAWDLTRRRFWPVAGFTLVLWLFSLLVQFGPSLLVLAIARRVLLGAQRLGAPVTPLPASLLILQAMLNLLTISIYRPLQTIGKTLLYFDLRVRTEGLDLVVLTQPGASTTPTAEALREGAPPAESQTLITGSEMMSFVLVSIEFTFCVIALLLGAGVLLTAIQSASLGGL